MIDRQMSDPSWAWITEIERHMQALKKEWIDARKRGDFDKASDAEKRAERLRALHRKVRKLQKEWEALRITERINKRAEVLSERASSRAIRGRLARGLRTPEGAFRKPILQALVEFGGSAPAHTVLARVEQMVKQQLSQYDYEPVPSSPREIRWWNTARWCRKILVNEGFLKSDSPRGIWEITELGRRELEKL